MDTFWSWSKVMSSRFFDQMAFDPAATAAAGGGDVAGAGALSRPGIVLVVVLLLESDSIPIQYIPN